MTGRHARRGANEKAIPPATAPLSRAQARALDERALRELAIPGLLLMENAGRGAAEAIAARWFRRGGRRGFARAARAVIFAGGGNNGGDGLVVARHLHAAGVDVALALCADRERLAADAAANLAIAERLGLRVTPIGDARSARAAVRRLRPRDVAIDALLGTGFRGELREPLATLIAALNAARAARRCAALVALDLPSGLDCDSGAPAPPRGLAITADLTITFAARKLGFAARGARRFTGAIVVAGLGVALAALRAPRA